MAQMTRRQLLAFFGAGAAATVLGPSRGRFGGTAEAAWPGGFTPVRVPHPLPIYQTRASYLATGIDTGALLPPAPDPVLASYTVVDDVVVPPEFERYVIVRWGDRVFPSADDYVGYNCDYTAVISLNGRTRDDALLVVNHEYVSFPFAVYAPDTPSSLSAAATTFAAVIGFSLPAARNLLAEGEMLYNCGLSVLRITRGSDGRYAVVGGDARNRRIHGLSGLGLNAGRTDGYGGVVSWGAAAHQQGDLNYLVGTGPAATDVFPLSSDGLGNKIIGTAFNCSGASTPWGTVLSAEENFQGSTAFFVGVMEDVRPNGTQTGYIDGTTGKTFGQVGEKYGWMVEVDPSGGPSRKHTALGRFRHENLALRVSARRRLVAYMGDDRRGGHTWKFVSRDLVRQTADPANSALFEQGTLYVARYNPDGTGQWIPLELSTPTNPIPPTVLSSVEFAERGTATRDGLIKLPRRNGVAGETIDGGSFNLTRTNEASKLPPYQGKSLADFYISQGALLCDAFLAANLAGGTPCARPEDFEINPRSPREVIMSMTDGAPGSDGYPDSRIFVVTKYSSAVDETQQPGALYKLIEDSEDGTGLTFRWERFVQGGEAGAVDGAGFAAPDNLAFDWGRDLWVVTDMSTERHNGFDRGTAGTPQTVDHTASGDTPSLVGVFGNNWMFTVPLIGPDAGLIVPFAIGPMRCEMTGPTFVDGQTLIVSVQHPGEDVPIGDGTVLSRSLEILRLDGTLTSQTRNAPRGSNWPDNVEHPALPLSQQYPRPSVIGIRRKQDR